MKKLLCCLIFLSILLCGCVPQGNRTEGGSTAESTGTEEIVTSIEDTVATEPEGETTKVADTTSGEEETQPPEQPKTKEILLTRDYPFASLYIAQTFENGLIIKGDQAGRKLTLPATIHLKSDLIVENITLVGNDTKIYANGHRLIIASNVTTSSRDDRLTVFGGGTTAMQGDTYLELLGGHYQNIYGGGENAAVDGDTYVIFGGKANSGDSADDSKSNFSPCRVYGGGSNASVSGSANVTIKDAAIAAYVSGAGSGSGGAKVKKTNIYIQGGKLMNVFGGSMHAAMTNVQTKIIMTGGLAEAIFGGSQSQSLSGSTDVRILGGDVSRRIYTGCYNNCNVGFFSDTWTSDAHVTGTTSLTIGPNAKLCTATELSYDNQPDMGVFCGSRYKNGFSNELNILIFLDGCAANIKSEIGPSSLSGWDLCTSRHSYIYDCSTGGELTLCDSGTAVRISPDVGYKAVYNGTTYPHAQNPNVNQIKIGAVTSSPQTIKIVFQTV